MAQETSTKKSAKKTPKKVILKEIKALKKGEIVMQYINPTRCDKCGYESTVRKEGVRCMHNPRAPRYPGQGCDGILVQIH